MTSYRGQLILVIMFITASCVGPTKWRNPNVPRQRWAVDRAVCESKAKRKMNKERTIEDMLKASDGTGGATSYEKNMLVYTDRRQASVLIGKCLKKLGYEVIP